MELGATLAVSAGWVIAYLVEETISGDDVGFSINIRSWQTLAVDSIIEATY